MPIQITQHGKLVAVEDRPYAEFTDQAGNKRPGGHTFRVYVSEGFHAPPQEIRCSLEQYVAAEKLGAGADVTSTFDVHARDNTLGLKLVSIDARISAIPNGAPGKGVDFAKLASAK